jgi:hypothetical protein
LASDHSVAFGYIRSPMVFVNFSDVRDSFCLVVGGLRSSTVFADFVVSVSFERSGHCHSWQLGIRFPRRYLQSMV